MIHFLLIFEVMSQILCIVSRQIILSHATKNSPSLLFRARKGRGNIIKAIFLILHCKNYKKKKIRSLQDINTTIFLVIYLNILLNKSHFYSVYNFCSKTLCIYHNIYDLHFAKFLSLIAWLWRKLGENGQYIYIYY